MNGKDLTALQDRYKNALLYRQEDKIRNLREQLSKEFSVEKDFFQKCDEWVSTCHALGEKAVEAARAGAKRDSLEFDELCDQAVALGGNVKQYVCAIFDKAVAEQQDHNYNQTVPDKISRGGVHPNSIPELDPAGEWTILFDETGTDFKETAFDKNSSDVSLGRMVALLVPKYTKLPSLPHFHATEKPLPTVQKKLHIIRSSRCGIIGIPVNGLQRIHAEQWFACIETTLDLILRLLPIDGDTNLKILVEQRGKITPQNTFNLQKTCDDCLFHLSRAFPERSKSIKITAKIITKNESQWNGYVDAIAFSWSSHKCKSMLRETGWQDTCLIGHKSSLLTSYIDIMEREGHLSQEEWNDLVIHQPTTQTNSLVGALLRNLGEKSRNDISLWQSYMLFALKHLNSKAIDLYALGCQVSWLKQWQPQEANLSPKLRLIWLTVKLAEKNHNGITNSYPAHREEFHKLSLELFLEDAPLACKATLHLAVSYTNEFDFEGARNILSFWDNYPPEVPGLQYYGQLLSSHGQHEAFIGNYDAAIKYFHDAINAFKRLSDSVISQADTSQTRAYLITALMDSGSNSDELREQLKLYYGMDLEEAAFTLSTSNSAVDKYRHHILLRYLVQDSSNNVKARKKYLAQKEMWEFAEGHPWEMIEFYRAMLCENRTDILEHLHRAYDISKTGGLTLQVIAAVILGSIYFYDKSVKGEFQNLVSNIRKSLPALGDRGDVLNRQIKQCIKPLELAQRVLPFSFR